MIILLFLAVAIAIALLRGGRIASLADVDYRWIWLLFLPLALQLVLFTPLADMLAVRADTLPSIYVLSMAIGAIVVGANLRLPGFPLLLVGLLSNLLVIVANGGLMPVSMPAREAAALPVFSGTYNNVIEMGPGSPLWFLGDVFPVPRPIPFATVLSLGDLAITLGAFWFTQRTMAPRAVPEPPHPAIPAGRP